MRAETAQLWLALRREKVEWDFTRKSVEFKGPCVYLAQSRHMPGRLKIGYTTHLRRRMVGIDAVAIAAISGTPEVEADFHERFAHLRVNRNREWFLSDRAIVDAFRAA